MFDLIFQFFDGIFFRLLWFLFLHDIFHFSPHACILIHLNGKNIPVSKDFKIFWVA